jgi:hypothetical protein
MGVGLAVADLGVGAGVVFCACTAEAIQARRATIDKILIKYFELGGAKIRNRSVVKKNKSGAFSLWLNCSTIQ